MRRFRAVATSIVVPIALGVAAVGLGCSALRDRDTPPIAPYAVLRSQDDAGRAANYPNLDKQTYETLAAALAAPPAGTPPTPTGPPRPLQILAVSGGGQYGAYGAGVLVGWTQTGQRPDFDVVTGISSGAFVASMVYIGPKWDWLLTKVFTTSTTKDLIKTQPVRSLLTTQSLSSSAPMKALIDREVTAEFCADVRAQHQLGRRCYIGTMNQNTRRVVIWDLGAIACNGRPDADDLVRKILLAAAAVPFLLPAVEFDITVNGVNYREAHNDGGTVCQSFVRLPPEAPTTDPADPAKRWLAGSKLYIIAGGKVFLDPVEGRPSALGRARGAASSSLYALYRSDLWRLYAVCAASGMEYRHTAVPQDAVVTASAFEFEPVEMLKLYKMGQNRIVCGTAWERKPPNTTPDEVELPRAGFDFTLPPPAPR